jgi:hypothetical protein
VNIISLSAGTGVAVWACENMDEGLKVYSVIMLGSSLSSTYDMSEALPHIENGVWVYYSPHDQILKGPVRALGTIDGKLNAQPAGLVGLHPPGGGSSKIHNIQWSARYERFGWTGAHTDATNETMVRQVLAQHILSGSSPRSTAGGGEQTVLSVTRQMAFWLDLDQNPATLATFLLDNPELETAPVLPETSRKEEPDTADDTDRLFSLHHHLH